jgi:hypothetical protein
MTASGKNGTLTNDPRDCARFRGRLHRASVWHRRAEEKDEEHEKRKPSNELDELKVL